MKLNFLEEIEILSSKFKIIWNKESDGGSFDWLTDEIIIGIKSYENNPNYTFSVLCHEIMECILAGMGARFDHSRIQGQYLFNYDHMMFENSIQIFSQTISKFIQQ